MGSTISISFHLRTTTLQSCNNFNLSRLRIFSVHSHFLSLLQSQCSTFSQAHDSSVNQLEVKHVTRDVTQRVTPTIFSTLSPLLILVSQEQSLKVSCYTDWPYPFSPIQSSHPCTRFLSCLLPAFGPAWISIGYNFWTGLVMWTSHSLVITLTKVMCPSYLFVSSTDQPFYHSHLPRKGKPCISNDLFQALFNTFHRPLKVSTSPWGLCYVKTPLNTLAV